MKDELFSERQNDFLLRSGQLLAEARLKKGISQKIIGRAIGCKRGRISAIENGQKSATLWELYCYIEYCNIDLMQIYEKANGKDMIMYNTYYFLLNGNDRTIVDNLMKRLAKNSDN